MLMILNLEWSLYDVHQKVVQASDRMNEILESRNAVHYVQYDLASHKAGEKVFFKSTPPEKCLSTKALDEIREEHAVLVAELRQDGNFSRYCDMAETLSAVRGHGLRLAAVFNGSADMSESVLKNTHLRDYFDQQVYASDIFGVGSRVSAALYSVICEANKVDPRKAMIVAQTLEGVIAGKQAGAHVVGYVPVEDQPDLVDEMKLKGAHHLVSSPAQIRILAGRMERYVAPAQSQRLN